MKQFINFVVNRKPSRWLALDDDAFFALYDYCEANHVIRRNYHVPREKESFFCIRDDKPDSATMQAILKMLEGWGWKPYPRIVPDILVGTHFEFRVTRVWEEADNDQAALLRLSQFGIGADYIFFLSDKSIRIASVESVESGSGPGWSEPFGYGGRRGELIVSRATMELFQDLKGIKFTPVQWDKPEEAKAEFWYLESDLIMPPGLIEIVINGQGLFYDEPGFKNPQLAFRESEVRAMGEFDIAWTREYVGPIEDKPHRSHGDILIVSQEFRRRAMLLPQTEERLIRFEPIRLEK